MEHGKSASSEIPSPENHDQDNSSKSTDDNTGVGRSYECAFCKRGFTNAQALGGHMNIHRKDKAKAKAKVKQDRHKHSYYQEESSAGNLGYYRPSGGQVNYQVYLPSSNPNFQTGIDYSTVVPVWGPGGGLEDPNLSLRFGQSEPGGAGEGNVKENELDLELRLGHDP